jgi:hypothetical protein
VLRRTEIHSVIDHKAADATVYDRRIQPNKKGNDSEEVACEADTSPKLGQVRGMFGSTLLSRCPRPRARDSGTGSPSARAEPP